MNNIKGFTATVFRSMCVVFCVVVATHANAVVLTSGKGASVGAHSSALSVGQSSEVYLAGSKNSISTSGTLVYEEVAFVDGVKTSIHSFSNLDMGTYSLTLTDFEFPDALNALGASFTTATAMVGSVLLGEESSSETLTFEIDQPDTYYLSVFGIAGSTYNLGMYGLELSQIGVSAVPLPTAAYLFFSGLMGLIFVRRGEGIRFPHARWLGLR
jgi:hypothetical protein